MNRNSSIQERDASEECHDKPCLPHTPVQCHDMHHTVSDPSLSSEVHAQDCLSTAMVHTISTRVISHLSARTCTNPAPCFCQFRDNDDDGDHCAHHLSLSAVETLHSRPHAASVPLHPSPPVNLLPARVTGHAPPRRKQSVHYQFAVLSRVIVVRRICDPHKWAAIHVFSIFFLKKNRVNKFLLVQVQVRFGARTRFQIRRR